MDSSPPAAAAAATAHLDQLTSKFTTLEKRAEQARTALHDGIVRHLRARNAPPGKIAEHTNYDRVHIGRIARAAGIPPLRGKGAPPEPTYDEATEAKAYKELDRLAAAAANADGKLDETRTELHQAIADYYTARVLGPAEIARHSPYDRNHINRIVRRVGAAPIRER